jgi:hypothetical protein
MSLLTRIAFLAYPPSFRDEYRTEWTRTVQDMRTHGGRSTTRVVLQVAVDVFRTAPRMRWENLMRPGSMQLTVVAAIAGTAGLIFVFPPLAVAVLVLAATVAIQAGRHDQPITTELTAWSARWHLWLVASAAFFFLGFGALLTEGDQGLTTAAWATWVLTWLTGAVLGGVGLGLGATRFVSRRRA